jgi:hypothetical protein
MGDPRNSRGRSRQARANDGNQLARFGTEVANFPRRAPASPLLMFLVFVV